MFCVVFYVSMTYKYFDSIDDANCDHDFVPLTVWCSRGKSLSSTEIINVPSPPSNINHEQFVRLQEMLVQKTDLLLDFMYRLERDMEIPSDIVCTICNLAICMNYIAEIYDSRKN